MEDFKTSVTVAAHKKVTFELTYEELLKRTHGKYELQIHARPMQPVKDFKMDVHIHEKAGIRFINVKGGLSTISNAITKTDAYIQAWIHFYPTVDQQKTCESCGEQGLNGDLVIVYDVNQDNGLGDVKISDGYFVHHFAPSNLPRIPKNVVFVIDRSGSMSGRKMEQTRTALIHILNDLAEDDFFGIISFDHAIFHWKRELVPATALNVERAKEFARSIHENGATNINGALLEGARMLNAQSREGSASILIFLTDGDPTAGETNLERIQSNVRQAVAEKFPLYCLGFGSDVNFEFLEKMSLQNNGVARRIYQDSDADLQLKDFYEEVATPLLTDITMIYVGGSNLTQTNFSQYYNGSEIVVAGEITDNNVETFTPQVVAYSSNRRVTFSNTSGSTEQPRETAENLLQRVWAYLTVKQLLDRELLLSGPEKDKVSKEALELSLKYSFVTPLTSMVVTKPQGEESVLHKPKEGKTPQFTGAAGSSLSFSAVPAASFPANYSPNPGRAVTRAKSSPAGAARSFLTSAGPAGGAGSLSTGFGFSGRLGLPGPPDFGPPAPTSSPGFAPVHPGSPGHPGFAPPVYPGSPGHPGFAPPVYPGSPGHPGFTPPGHPGSPGHPGFPGSHGSGSPALISHRFLFKTENQSATVCFDLPGSPVLKLLHHPSKSIYINGALNTVTNGGFRNIFIQVQIGHYVDISPEGIWVLQGASMKQITGQNPIQAGSLTVIPRGQETDILANDFHIVVLGHQRDGNKFLWPVLKKKPSGIHIDGVLVSTPANYTVEPLLSMTLLKIPGSFVRQVYNSSATDYSVTSPVTVQCWFTMNYLILGRPLNFYLV